MALIRWASRVFCGLRERTVRNTAFIHYYNSLCEPVWGRPAYPIWIHTVEALNALRLQMAQCRYDVPGPQK